MPKINPEKLSFEELANIHPIYAFFIRRWRIAFLLIASIVAAGIGAYIQLPKEIHPDTQIPIVFINTTYLGASTSDIEALITNPIEDEMDSLSNIAKMTSSSSSGLSTISIEFDNQIYVDDALEDVKDKLDIVKSKLPNEANDPVASKISFNAMPIIILSLSGNMPENELQSMVAKLQTEIKKIKDIDEAMIFGKRNIEYEIILDSTKLAKLNLTLGQVISTIQGFHIRAPAGIISLGQQNYEIRLDSKAKNTKDLAHIPITTGNRPILLGDIAQIRQKLSAPSMISYVALAPNYDIQRSVSIAVMKKTGGNVLQASDTIKELATEFSNNYAGLSVSVTGDDAQYVREDFKILGKSAIQTMILIVILLFFFIGGRESLLTSSTLPLVFLSGFIILSALGSSISSMTLFALILSLGLIVDNTIVITESFYANWAIKKMPADKAALLAVRTFAGPLISGTLTTVAAFMPMLLVSGIMGQFLSIMPKTISATLVSSLFIALFLLPAVMAYVFRHREHRVDSSTQTTSWWQYYISIWDKWRLANLRYIENRYESLLSKLLPNKKNRRKFLAYAFGLLAFSFLFPISGLMKVEMFPVVDNNNFFIEYELETGANIIENEKRIKTELMPILQKIASNIPVENMLVTIGGKAGISTVDERAGPTSYNKGQITINLTPKETRDITSYEIADIFRSNLNKFDGFKTNVVNVSAGPPVGAPIQIRISGDDMPTLSSISKQITKILETVKGTVNIAEGIEKSRGEFVYYPYPEILAKYGLTARDIGLYIRTMTYGTEIGNIRVSGDSAKIWLKTSNKREKISGNLTSLAQLDRQIIFTPTKQKISLATLGKWKWESSMTSIYHRNGTKMLTVKSNVLAGYTAAEVSANIEKYLAQTNWQPPAGYTVEIGGEREDISQSFTELWYAMIIGVALIAFILILQFDSFKQPLIILFTFPLSLIGVFWGLMITGIPLSFPAFIGVVSLAGIVVNDAIILIAKIKENREEKDLELLPAIIDAGKSRIQAILLTTLTTIFGIFPLVIASEIWRGLGLAIIFGLIVATVLTLVVVPVLYYGIEQQNKDNNKNK